MTSIGHSYDPGESASLLERISAAHGLMGEGEALAEVVAALAAQWQSAAIVGGSAGGRAAILGALARTWDGRLATIALGPEELVRGTGAKCVEVPLAPHDRDERVMHAGLQAALRQDPDALLIAEPDRESLATAVTAMFTGTMVVLTQAGPLEEAAETILAGAAASLPGDSAGLRAMIGPLLRIVIELETTGTSDRFKAVHIFDAVAGRYAPLLEEDGSTVVRHDERAAGFLGTASPEAVQPAPGGSPTFAPEDDWSDLIGDSPPLEESVLDRLEQRYGSVLKTAHAPRFGRENPPATASKFGGSCMVGPKDGEWPRAEASGRPMQLVFQLRVDELPAEVRGHLEATSGWWQCFYDTAADGEGEPWAGFAGVCLVRVLPDQGATPAEEPEDLDRSHAYRSLEVEGWTPLMDAPHTEDLEGIADSYGDAEEILVEGFFSTYGLPDVCRLKEASEEGDAFRASLKPLLKWLGVPDVASLERALGYLRTHGGDKLMGWPAWAQGSEVPRCPTSGKPMRFLAQLSAESTPCPLPGEGAHFPMLFAGDGTAQIFQSPVDPTVMTMVWACG